MLLCRENVSCRISRLGLSESFKANIFSQNFMKIIVYNNVIVCILRNRRKSSHVATGDDLFHKTFSVKVFVLFCFSSFGKTVMYMYKFYELGMQRWCSIWGVLLVLRESVSL